MEAGCAESLKSIPKVPGKLIHGLKTEMHAKSWIVIPGAKFCKKWREKIYFIKKM